MVNAVDMAKRALVKLLKELAVLYSLTVGVTRDSPDPAVRTAYRKVSVGVLCAAAREEVGGKSRWGSR